MDYSVDSKTRKGITIFEILGHMKFSKLVLKLMKPLLMENADDRNIAPK